MAADQPDYTNAVFGNDLLFDYLAGYLGISDLKILRQTCKLLYSKVNGNRKFISNLRLTISDHTIRENGMCDSITWGNVSFVVNRTSSQHFQNIRTDCIEDLELLHPTTKDLTQLTKDKESRLAYELLEVRQFPNLRSMTLDLNLMCYDIPMAAMASVVGTVKELRFQRLETFQFSPKGEEGRIAQKNLEMMGGLPWKLHSFVIEGLRLSKRIAKAVGAIPASSASTLQQLKLCSDRFGREKYIHGVRFLQLKTICLEINGTSVYDYDGIPLAEFLYLLPQLEAIEINCQTFDYSERFAPSVLEAVRRTCSSELHTLRLRGPVWLHSFPDFESWTFVRDLARLKNVTINAVYLSSEDTDNVVAEILNCLPSGTQSMELNYVKLHIVVPYERLAALAGFQNLVQLKIELLNGSGSLINDAVLQTICRSAIKLRVFHFGSTEITDFGLTGERGNYNSGISLRNLKGLQDLAIYPYKRGELTENGILRAIQFPELRKLKLFTLISNPAVVEIATHNPSLEYVACFFGIERDDAHLDDYFHSLFSSIMPVNPRLTLRVEDFFPDVLEGVVPDEVICRPSYGVSANLVNTTTLLHIRNTMKIVKSSKTEATYTYYYNLLN